MEIIGKGFVGKNLKKINLNKKNNFIIYCAGVSNSKSTSQKKYFREIKRIKNTIKKMNNKTIFVYISTTSILDKFHSRDKYVKNKIIIEKIIRKKINRFIILRFPQIIGRNNNPYIISNFIFNKIKNRRSFELWSNVKRNFIDIDDVKKIVKNILNKNFQKNLIINIFNSRSVMMEDLVHIFSRILNIKANYEIMNYNLNKSNKKIIVPKNEKKIIFRTEKKYLDKIIRKYYK